MSETPRLDFHIHTQYLRCADATMEVAAIVRECGRLGVRQIGITDHLNSLDKLPLHTLIRRDIESLARPVPDVFFGVELNFTGCDQGFAYNADIQAQVGFQFAIGGIHAAYLETYDLKKLVDIQHRHHLKTCADPLVDVLVHPYWFSKGEFDRNGWPWFDSLAAVPERYARELGQAARETGTAIEINASANLVNANQKYVEEYLEFLAAAAEEGACFSVGSDAHTIGSLKDITASWDAVAKLGLTPERIWRPEGNPLKGAANAGGGEPASIT